MGKTTGSSNLSSSAKLLTVEGYIKRRYVMNITQFIQAVRDEKRGFTLDQPWRLEETSLFAIVPILRKTAAKRKYITFAEAKAVHVEDTGQIDYVHVKNSEDQPVFISLDSFWYECNKIR